MKELDPFGLQVICRLAKENFPRHGTLDETIISTEKINMKQPNTEYSVGDVVFEDELPNGCVLQCIQSGRTA